MLCPLMAAPCGRLTSGWQVKFLLTWILGIGYSNFGWILKNSDM